jgi:hypothetical protein
MSFFFTTGRDASLPKFLPPGPAKRVPGGWKWDRKKDNLVGLSTWNLGFVDCCKRNEWCCAALLLLMAKLARVFWALWQVPEKLRGGTKKWGKVSDRVCGQKQSLVYPSVRDRRRPYTSLLVASRCSEILQHSTVASRTIASKPCSLRWATVALAFVGLHLLNSPTTDREGVRSWC